MLSNPAPTNVLNKPDERGKMDADTFDWHAHAEMMMRVLLTQLNFWRKQLGMNPVPTRCPHCKCELK